MGRPLPTALGHALDDAFMEPTLTRLFQDLVYPGARIASVTSEVVKRRTIRYTIALEGQEVESWNLIGKVYESREAGERGFAALRWLWEQGFAARPPLSITLPRALTYLPELELLLMEEAGGRSLKRLLHSGDASPTDVRAFADALIKLHSFPASYDVPFTLQHFLELRCRGQSEALALGFPDLADSIDRILVAARRTRGDRGPVDSTLVHGDYHPGQVHVDGVRTWLIDPDFLHQGDPAFDVAMVVLTLKGMGAKQENEARYRRLLEHFLATYFSRMNPSLAERVPLHAALIFLKRACKRFHYQDTPGWEYDVRLQVGLGMECLERMEQARRPRDVATVLELCAACPAAE